LILQVFGTPTTKAESLGIAKSREAMAEADVVLLVLDATTPLHKEDEAAIAVFGRRPLIIVINKSDLVRAAPLSNPDSHLSSKPQL